jgi:FixJ family two-component response regulator
MKDVQPTVFVIDDEFSVRKAIARLLQSAGLAVVTYGSALEYLEGCSQDAHGCLLLDLSMPGINGLQLQKTLAERGNPPPIIFLTGRADIPDSVQAMKGGAIDFLTKPVDEDTLLGAVRNALAADCAIRSDRAELAEISHRLATLTPRELQVLHCVVAGKLNKQTAAELGTVEKTIKVHRAHVMEKMQANSLAELVRLAARAGISITSAR